MLRLPPGSVLWESSFPSCRLLLVPDIWNCKKTVGQTLGCFLSDTLCIRVAGSVFLWDYAGREWYKSFRYAWISKALWELMKESLSKASWCLQKFLSSREVKAGRVYQESITLLFLCSYMPFLNICNGILLGLGPWGGCVLDSLCHAWVGWTVFS